MRPAHAIIELCTWGGWNTVVAGQLRESLLTCSAAAVHSTMHNSILEWGLHLPLLNYVHRVICYCSCVSMNSTNQTTNSVIIIILMNSLQVYGVWCSWIQIDSYKLPQWRLSEFLLISSVDDHSLLELYSKWIYSAVLALMIQSCKHHVITMGLSHDYWWGVGCLLLSSMIIAMASSVYVLDCLEE